MISWLGRFVRGRRPDRNPLRRGSDRAETAMLTVLVAAFLAGAPFAARAAGTWTDTVAHRVQAEQQASRQEVSAVLLKAAPVRVADEGTDPEVPARWTARNGALMRGDVPAPPGTAAGVTVRVWVARDGQFTSPPLRDSQISWLVALSCTVAVTGLGLLLVITGLLTRRELDKRRMAAWDAEWRTSGPNWTTRA